MLRARPRRPVVTNEQVETKLHELAEHIGHSDVYVQFYAEKFCDFIALVNNRPLQDDEFLEWRALLIGTAAYVYPRSPVRPCDAFDSTMVLLSLWTHCAMLMGARVEFSARQVATFFGLDPPSFESAFFNIALACNAPMMDMWRSGTLYRAEYSANK